MLAPAVIAFGSLSALAGPAAAAPITTSAAPQLMSASTTASLAVTINGGADMLSNSTRPVISGTSTGSTGKVNVAVAGQNYVGVVSPTGDWSVVVTSDLVEYRYAIYATAYSASGQLVRSTQNVTIDTTAPAITVDGGQAASTSLRTPKITGTAAVPDGSRITVAVDGTTQDAVVSASRWVVTPPQLAIGAHIIAATAPDAAGNVGAGFQRLTVKTSALAIDGGTSRLTNNATPTIAGTTDAPVGTTVTVTGAGDPLVGTVTAAGTWSVTAGKWSGGASLPAGAYTVTAALRDAGGNLSTAQQTITVDLIGPAIVIDGGSIASTWATAPAITGRTDLPAGSKMKVTIDDVANDVVVSATRTWSVTAPELAAGNHTVVVSATDAAGNESSQRQRLSVLVLSIDGGPTRLTNNGTPTIAGTLGAPAGTLVTVTVGTQALTGKVTATGTWSVTAQALPSAAYPVVASVRDAAGTAHTAKQTLTVDTIAPAIVIDGGSAVSTASHAPAITGRTDMAPGSTLTVAVDGDAQQVTVSSTKTWSATAPALTVGTHAVVVSATDAAGNEGTQRQRLTVTPALSIDGGTTKLTNNATPTIRGTTDAPAGAVVTVTVGGQSLTGAVSAEGTWSVKPSTLASAVYPVVATVPDAVGTAHAARQTLTVDTIAPAIVIDGGSIVSTKSTTPSISGRTDLPAGSTITVTVDGVAKDLVISSTRTWSMTTEPLSVGLHSVVVSATDAAGNEGTQRQRLTVLA